MSYYLFTDLCGKKVDKNRGKKQGERIISKKQNREIKNWKRENEKTDFKNPFFQKSIFKL